MEEEEEKTGEAAEAGGERRQNNQLAGSESSKQGYWIRVTSRGTKTIPKGESS
jgi:hypothetical protein